MSKLRITNSKSRISANGQNSEIAKEHPRDYYGLEDRTCRFSKNIAQYCKQIPYTAINIIYIKQLVRSSGSIGANYIEANESLGKKDFKMRIKICIKESKESEYRLKLIAGTNSEAFHQGLYALAGEAVEFRKIFSSIANRS